MLKGKLRNKCIHKKSELASIKDKMRVNQIVWNFNHVQCRPINTLVRRRNMMAVEEEYQPWGRPKQQ